MKFKITFPTILSVLLMSSISCMAVDTAYDTLNRELSVSGEYKAGEFVTCTVTKNGTALSEGQADDNVIYNTVQTGNDGIFRASFILPDFYTNGKYVISTIGASKLSESVIGYVKENAELYDLSKINSAENTSSMQTALTDICTQFEIDADIYSKYGSIIAKNVLERRPTNGYKYNDFIESYYLSEGISLFVQGEISLDELCMRYCAYTGVDYDSKLNSLSSEIHASANTLMRESLSANYGNFADMLDDKITVATLINSTSYVTLQKEFLNITSNYNVDLYGYNNLKNDYYREAAFRSLYKNKSSAKSMNDIISLFYKAVDDSKKQENTDDKTTGTGGGSSGGGGGGGFSSGTGTVPPVNTSDETRTDNTAFSDISGHWAEGYITEMKKLNIINGFDDMTFRPDNDITRAEFVKMVCAVAKIDAQSGNTFSDVKNDDWFSGCVYAAYNNGIINGISENTFSPNAQITRQDAAAIIYRMLKPEVSSELDFDDADSVASYAVEAIASLSKSGILYGNDGKIYPLNKLTRAESAVMLDRAFYYLNGRAVSN